MDKTMEEISAEVHFAQKLASNEKKYRDRALKRLQKYLSIRSSQGDGMSQDDFLKVWKGLHFCMWMQDKPLIQEELSQRVAKLLHSFSRISDSLRFINVFFITEAREWHLIDRFRIDKFMRLIRDVLHEIFATMSQAGWPLSACEAFSRYLANSVMSEDNPKLPDGLKLHMADIFMPELRKVSLEKMTGKKMTILMFPFASFILKTRKMNLASKVVSQTITPVLRRFGSWSSQEETASDEEDDASDDDDDSDAEEEDEEEMEVDDSDETEKKKKKPLMKFDMTKLLKLMFKMAENKNIRSKNRAMVYKIVQHYSTKVGKSVLPLVQSKESEQEVDEDADNDSGDGDTVAEHILEQCWPIPEEEESNTKKRRKRRKKQQRENDAMRANLPKKNATDPGKGDNTTVESFSHRKGDNAADNIEVEAVISASVTITTPGAKKGKKRKRDSGDDLHHHQSPEKKVKKLSPKCDYSTPNGIIHGRIGSIDGDVSNETVETKNQDSPVSKKKKDKESPVSKKKKMGSPKDKNSNSRSPRMEIVNGNLTLHSSPAGPKEKPTLEMSCGDKSPPKNKNKKAAKQSSDRTSTPTNGTPTNGTPTNGVAPKAGGGPTVKDEASAHSLLEIFSTPLNNLGKKSLVLPASDPGLAPRMIQREDSSGSMTPGTKKKVVFDLRKNKANKFQDYLKSLVSDSPPVHEPTKSPSQGILKSPCLSPATSSISLDSDAGRTFRKKGAGGSGSKKARRASQSPTNSKKQSPKRKSPKKK